MRPLIGVTTAEMRPGELATLQRDGMPPHPEMALGTTYLRAIEAAGGIPVILAPTQLEAVPALGQRRRRVLAQHRGQPPPRQRAPPRRQVQVELERVDPRRVDVAAARA